ncbi:MAG: DUF4112 domain-containing protein [Geminicoccaceae bacterium]
MVSASTRSRTERPAHDRRASAGTARPATGSARAAHADERVEAALRRLDRFAFLLDDAWRIPLLGRRIGLDGVVGLVPGIGDAVTGLVALYPLLEARRLGAPSGLLLRMLANIGTDAVLGAVPLAGDLLDFAFKANRRNVALLRRHLSLKQAEGR